MDIKIINEHEIEFNNKVFKIGDNVSIENTCDTYGIGKLFCIIPSLNTISIECEINGHIEAKIFWLEDITHITKLNDGRN